MSVVVVVVAAAVASSVLEDMVAAGCPPGKTCLCIHSPRTKMASERSPLLATAW